MVDRQVHEEHAVAGVDGIDQFDELVHRCGAAVEFGQGRVNGEKVEGGEGAAEAPHPRIGGGTGVDGQQLDDAKAHLVHNEVELLSQRTEGAGRGDDRVAVAVEGVDRVAFVIGRALGREGARTELADEGAVHGVAADGGSRFHFDGEVLAGWPDEGIAVSGDKVGLGFEDTYFAQG